MSDGSNKDPQRALVFATGDIIVDEPDPYSFFEPSRELLSSGDFVIGQIEVPHTVERQTVRTFRHRLRHRKI